LVDERPPDDVGSPLDLDAGAEGSSHFSKDSIVAGIVMAAIVSNRTSGSSPNAYQSEISMPRLRWPECEEGWRLAKPTTFCRVRLTP
jgi:hypothetical protein